MKTVMKKLMSLMLVAILLVSAVPFQADAAMTADANGNVTVPVTVNINNGAEVYTDKSISVPADGSVSLTWDFAKSTVITKKHDVRSLDHWASTTNPDVTGKELSGTWLTTKAPDDYALTIYINEASAPTPTTIICDNCKTTYNEGDAHECCTECKTAGHTAENCPNKVVYCSNCGEGHETSACPYCTICLRDGTKNPNHTATAHCSDCGLVGQHTAACITNCNGSASCTAQKHYDTCKTQTGITITFKNAYSGAADDVRTGCALGSSIVTPGAAFVNGYSFQGWNINGTLYGAGKELKVTPTLDNAVIYASYVDTNPTATYKLNVYVRRIVGNVHRDTQLLTSCSTMQEKDNILEWVSANKTDLENLIASKYPGYGWSGHVYNYYGDQVTATTTLVTTNGEKNIYFNLYTNEEDILVYVHTSSSSSYDRLIEIDGFVAGESVSHSTVLSNVKKYYSGSNLSMTMYSESGWNDYRNGKSNTDTYSVNVVDGTTKIHVVLKNASSSSSSSVADSSNPKTGDEIYMAVTAMAVSATALALCFFYNKKRAVK